MNGQLCRRSKCAFMLLCLAGPWENRHRVYRNYRCSHCDGDMGTYTTCNDGTSLFVHIPSTPDFLPVCPRITHYKGQCTYCLFAIERKRS